VKLWVDDKTWVENAGRRQNQNCLIGSLVTARLPRTLTTLFSNKVVSYQGRNKNTECKTVRNCQCSLSYKISFVGCLLWSSNNHQDALEGHHNSSHPRQGLLPVSSSQPSFIWRSVCDKNLLFNLLCSS
jgi:hypothetical protein